MALLQPIGSAVSATGKVIRSTVRMVAAGPVQGARFVGGACFGALHGAGMLLGPVWQLVEMLVVRFHGCTGMRFRRSASV